MERKYCEKRKVFSLALKDDRVDQYLRSCGGEFQVWGPKQEKMRNHESRVCIVRFSAYGCQKKSVVYETECRHVAVQRGNRIRTIYSIETHTSDFILNTF